MVSFRKIFLFAYAIACGTACTQVLGIDDRSLRANESESSSGNLGNTDAGSTGHGGDFEVRTDSGSEGGLNIGGNDPARAVFSANAIDFGMVSCGDTAPADRILTISNAGDFELDWQATLSSSTTFSFDGASAGAVQGQSFTSIKIASTGFPPYATASQTEQATLTITIMIKDEEPESFDFPITQTAAGASLVVTPGLGSFGQVQIGQTAAIPIELKNTGNLPMTVSLGAQTDWEFSIGSDAGTTLLAPSQSMSGLTAYFAPADADPSISSVSITTGGSPLCGVAPTALHFTGQGTSGPISVQPGSLDFGLVDCGGAGTAQQVTMTTTGASLAWTASLGKGASSPYILSAASGTASSVTPGVLTVTPKAIPTSSAITPDLYADTLTVTTPDGPHVIPLHQTAHGAILSQSVSSVAFGGVSKGTTATSSFEAVNDGNAPAVVSFSTVNSAFVIAPQGVTLGGAGYQSLTTVSFSPTAATTYNGSATMAVSPGTVLCAPLPAAMPLTGTGTINYVTVSPSSLDFGLVSCGLTASPKNVTLQNTAPSGGASFNWTAILSKGSASAFTLDNASGTLQANKSFNIKVSPKAIPSVSPVTADYYADTLTITTDAAGDPTPHVIALHETAQGVILALAPSSLDFGNVTGGGSSSLPFEITNSGNIPAHVSLSATGSGFSAEPSGSTTVNGGTSVQGTATYHAIGSSGAHSGSVTASFSEASCGGAVTPMTLSGNKI